MRISDPPACAADPELWFADDIDQDEGGPTLHERLIEQAKAHCQVCPYKTACLDAALSRSEYGIWGGLTRNERKALRRRAARRDARDAA